jgi:hypothetical protein
MSEMTTIARLAGNVVVKQFWNDHHPPHFHAFQAEHEALIQIADFAVYRGWLPPGALIDVVTWGRNHQAELALNWVLADAKLPMRRISSP